MGWGYPQGFKMIKYCKASKHIRLSQITLIILFLLSLSSIIFAQNTENVIKEWEVKQYNEDKQLLRTTWTNGWYFLTGIGFTGGFIVTNDFSERASGGGHISTAIGYNAMNAYGIEIGSLVSFNIYDGLPAVGDITTEDNYNVIVWDTAFYWGIRARIPQIIPSDNINPYVKLFLGYGQSVGFITDIEIEEYSYLKEVRLHNEGPLYGFSLGNIFNTKDSSSIWFIEFTLLLQLHWDTHIVESSEELPVIVESKSTTDNKRILRGNLSIGVRLI